jgi:hypothetical protein
MAILSCFQDFFYSLNAAAQGRRSLCAVPCSRLFDLLLDVFEVPVPDVEFLTGLPSLHVRSGVEPCHNPLQSGIGIVGTTTKFDYYVQLIFLPTTAAVTSICLDSFLDEGVKKLIESLLPISGDDELPTPLGELNSMLLLPESRGKFFLES